MPLFSEYLVRCKSYNTDICGIIVQVNDCFPVSSSLEVRFWKEHLTFSCYLCWHGTMH